MMQHCLVDLRAISLVAPFRCSAGGVERAVAGVAAAPNQRASAPPTAVLTALGPCGVAILNSIALSHPDRKSPKGHAPSRRRAPSTPGPGWRWCTRPGRTGTLCPAAAAAALNMSSTLSNRNGCAAWMGSAARREGPSSRWVADLEGDHCGVVDGRLFLALHATPGQSQHTSLLKHPVNPPLCPSV